MLLVLFCVAKKILARWSAPIKGGAQGAPQLAGLPAGHPDRTDVTTDSVAFGGIPTFSTGTEHDGSRVLAVSLCGLRPFAVAGATALSREAALM